VCVCVHVCVIMSARCGGGGTCGRKGGRVELAGWAHGAC